MDKLIAFNVPYVSNLSREFALDALNSNHQQGDGKYTKLTANILSKLVGGGKVFLTPSCTDALEMANMLIGIGPGDEVIMPSYTFTSGAISVTKFGGVPVFVDIDRTTKCIDTNQIESVVSPRTKAISWVNYGGVAPDINHLKSLADKFGLVLIEDNAHGLGGMFENQPLGSFGDFATQSFHATKNFQCGEGGALVVNNPAYVQRAEIVREKGTNRSQYIRGEIHKYQWVDQGSSYLMAEVNAAILLGQLQSFDFIQQSRREIISFYFKLFEEFDISVSHRDCVNAAHLFYFESSSSEQIVEIENQLRQNGVATAKHYQPLDSSLFGRRFPRHGSTLYQTQLTSQNLLRLPVWVGLNLRDLNVLTDALTHVLKR